MVKCFYYRLCCTPRNNLFVWVALHREPHATPEIPLDRYIYRYFTDNNRTVPQKIEAAGIPCRKDMWHTKPQTFFSDRSPVQREPHWIFQQRNVPVPRDSVFPTGTLYQLMDECSGISALNETERRRTKCSFNVSRQHCLKESVPDKVYIVECEVRGVSMDWCCCSFH